MNDGQGARILVGDDAPANVRLLEAVLTSRGYEVVSASDGLTALELVESANPDLVPARQAGVPPARACRC